MVSKLLVIEWYGCLGSSSDGTEICSPDEGLKFYGPVHLYLFFILNILSTYTKPTQYLFI